MTKTEKNLRSFNLNSLPMLREILRHGSVTKAAVALNVSQPALSAALRQLRHLFDDELIVRRNGGIILTPRAESLLAPLESALQSIQALVSDSDGPADRDIHRIKIATTDYTMHLLSSPLVRALLDSDTTLGVQFLNVGGHSVAQLMSGGIEMIITPRAMMTTGLASTKGLRDVNSEHLLTQHLLCIGRRDDAALTAGLSVDDYLDRPHVSLALDADLNISVERTFLAERSLKQNDVLLTSSYSSLPGIVAATGCLSLIPESMAKAVSQLYPLQYVEPPIAFPPLELVMVWHRRNDTNLAMIQLRNILKHCVGESDTQSPA
jgi:LysR family transcriptional regulator, nod-box dependent transcriptional activator